MAPKRTPPGKAKQTAVAPAPAPVPVPAPVPTPAPEPVVDKKTTVVTAGANNIWTPVPIIEPSGEGTGFSGDGTRLIFVDDLLGSDSNTGTEASPKQTATAGRNAMRSGYPDHLLLKCGGIWTESINIDNFSGRSLTERALISYYGSISNGLPMFKLLSGVAGSAIECHLNSGIVDFIAFKHFQIYAPERNPDDPAWDPATPDGFRPAGISMGGRSTSQGILFEGLVIRFPLIGINYTTGTPDGTTLRKPPKLRNCIITDCYGNTATQPQGGTGALIGDLDPTGFVVGDFLIEGMIFDHNGWQSDRGVANTNRLGFTRGLYIQVGSGSTPSPKPTFRNNFYIRDGSGPAFRAGGDIYNSAFWANPWSITIGFPTAGVHELSYNSVLNAVPATFNNLGHGLKMDGTTYDGLSLSVGTAYAHHNILAHNNSGNPFRAIDMYNIHGAVVQLNVVDDWEGDPGSPYEDGDSAGNTLTPNSYGLTYSDNTRGLDTYAVANGHANEQAFVDAAAAERLTSLTISAKFTANAYNNYIRTGYDQAAI